MFSLRKIVHLDFLLLKRYLHPKQRWGFVSVNVFLSFLGIVIGVASLIIVNAIMTGFHDAFLKRLLQMQGHIVIEHTSGQPFLNSDRILTILEEYSNITKVTPYLTTQGLLRTKQTSVGTLIMGTPLENKASLPSFLENLGTLSTFKGLIPGRTLANRLRVQKGDSVQMILASGNTTPFGFLPVVIEEPILTTFSTGIHAVDDNITFMSIKRTATLLNLPANSVGRIDVLLKHPSQASNLRKTLQKNKQLQNFFIRDWEQNNRSIRATFSFEKRMTSMLLSLIILIAGLNIISAMTMLVREKQKEIAILKAMGMTRLEILRLFLSLGATIGFLGVIIGGGLGIFLALNIRFIQFILESLGIFIPITDLYELSYIPSELHSDMVVKVMLFGFLISVLAAMRPAWKAASLNPAPILQNP